jgi:hypothetical protein
MLCNVIFETIINFTIYIEGFMNIFIVYISIIGPQFHFDCTNFKVTLIIKKINYEVKNGHLCFPSSMWMWLLVKISNYSHGIQAWFILCQMTWFNIHSTFINTTNHLNFLWSIFMFLSTHVRYIHLYILIFHFIKRNEIVFYFLLPMLYSNIICKNIVKTFQKFEVGYSQTCTSLESNTMWHPKGGHLSVLSPLNIWKWMLLILLVRCKWHTTDPRCTYGKLPHIDVGCKCSLPLVSKCQLRKFKYVCRSRKGTRFHSFKINAYINIFHGIAIGWCNQIVQWELLAYYKLCTITCTHNIIRLWLHKTWIFILRFNI